MREQGQDGVVRVKGAENRCGGRDEHWWRSWFAVESAVRTPHRALSGAYAAFPHPLRLSI